MKRRSEEGDKPKLPDLTPNKEVVTTIVEMVIIFLAVVIAVFRSRQEISNKATQLTKFINLGQKKGKLEIALNKILALSASDRVMLEKVDNKNKEYSYITSEVANIGIKKISEAVKKHSHCNTTITERLNILQATQDNISFINTRDNEIVTEEKRYQLSHSYKVELLGYGITCSYEILVGENAIISIQYISKDPERLEIFKDNIKLILKIKGVIESIIMR